MADRAFFKAGSVLLIAGTLLGLVFNVMHPRDIDFSDLTRSTLSGAAGSDSWKAIHLGLVVAVFLVILGLAAFSRSITGDSGTALARLGFVAALIGGGALMTALALDGVAVKSLADAYLGGGDDAGVALIGAQALLSLNSGLLSIAIVGFFGITNLLFGMAVAMGEGYPKWLGWVAALLGAVAIAAGAIYFYDGNLTQVTLIVFVLVSLLLTVWGLIAGILLWRKASTP